MRKLSFLYLVLAIFALSSDNIARAETILVGGDLYLDVYEDGVMSGQKIIASPTITNIKGPFEVYWKHIYITPFDANKDVNLKMEFFSTNDGTIDDFELNGDKTITFTIKPGAYIADPSSSRDINIWMKLSDYNTIEEFNANMVFWSNVVNEKVTVEWKESDSPNFELPYKKVF